MTSQTKHYIDVSDIVALRFQCKRCGASISLPVIEQQRTESLFYCPNCNENWTVINPSPIQPVSIDSSIKEFMRSLKNFAGVLHRTLEIQGEGGFTMTLEVKASASPGEA